MARILIIDDSPDVRLTLRTALESVGHAVTEAADGIEGIKRFSAEPSQLVITDILMPNKEGLETIRDLRKINQDLKIVAISGGSRANAVDFLNYAKSLGADMTLRKPIRMDDLYSAVDRCLASAK
jgi:CheY-like chemotaxis protein